jgi:CheY-like chemotaxis protein
MPIIHLFSASHCDGDTVARKTAEKTGGRLLTHEQLLAETSSRFHIAEGRVHRALHGPRSVFDRFTRERERSIACIKLALAELVRDDGVVYHGFAGHLLPRSLTHVLRVCLVAGLDHRVASASAALGIGPVEARTILRRDDEEREQWTLHLFGLGPWNAGLYDLVCQMDAVTVEAAAGEIAAAAGRPSVQATPAAREAMDDFLLSSKVSVVLAGQGHDVEVAAVRGEVTITIHRYVARLAHLELELRRAASAVAGARTVRTRVGPHYDPPAGSPGPARPGKILLVDDEKEFVQALSERLETRNLESAVAYNGEDAMAVMRADAPDIVVLDLKMPGLDGLEVLRHVKREHPATEVIVLTGNGSESEERRAMELGAYAYMKKPANVDELANAMKEAYGKIARASRNGTDGGVR